MSDGRFVELVLSFLECAGVGKVKQGVARELACFLISFFLSVALSVCHSFCPSFFSLFSLYFSWARQAEVMSRR